MTTVHDVHPTRRAARAGVVLLVVLLVVLVAWPPHARAVGEEEGGAAPAEGELTFEELQQQSSQRAREFFPEEYQEPSFFRWISIPNVLIGLTMAVALLGAYLWWQPKFAAERRAKQRR